MDTRDVAGSDGTGEMLDEGGASWSTIRHAFEASVRQDPERLAVVDDRGYGLTRSQLQDVAVTTGAEMRARGLAAGDVVLICMPNWTEWLGAYLATVHADMVPATAPVTADAGSLSDMIDRVGAKAVILPARHRGRDFAADAAKVAERLDRNLHVLLIEGDQHRRTWRTFAGPAANVPARPANTAHVLFSSSTTGKSKAIAHSDDTLGAYNRGVIDRYGITGDHPIFMPSPLGHSTGFWHGARMAVLTGAKLVLQDRWDPRRACELVEQHGCVITVAAAPFLTDLVNVEWDAPLPKLAGMSLFLCGGAPVPPALIELARSELPDTRIGAIWALSEGGATSSLPGDPPGLVASGCGCAMPGVALETIGVNGEIAPRGTEGEIVMRTPSLFLGYIGQGELYRSSFTDGGFFRTGDVGLVDEHDYLQITGRLKDLIIRGGVNIAPVEIENPLAAHDRVGRVAVVGRPDERLGERICAVVQPRGQPPTLEELTAWLSDRGVPQRLWPESIVIVPAMPETPAGKIRKNEVRQMIAEEKA